MAKKTRKKVKMVEVARSFSFKKNLGNYEMADFFCSAKKEVKETEAEATSEALYAFARAEVIKSINLFLGEGKKPDQGRSIAEKSDLKAETRDGVMIAAADDDYEAGPF